MYKISNQKATHGSFWFIVFYQLKYPIAEYLKFLHHITSPDIISVN